MSKDYIVKAYQTTRNANTESLTETRYRVFDLDGNMVDDAQGYGYKSARNAHVGYHYTRHPDKIRANKKLKQRVHRWCDQHADIDAIIDVYLFDTLKNGEKLSAVEEKALFEGLTENLPSIPFSAADYFKYR